MANSGGENNYESESGDLVCYEEDSQALYWCRESLYQTIQWNKSEPSWKRSNYSICRCSSKVQLDHQGQVSIWINLVNCKLASSSCWQPASDKARWVLWSTKSKVRSTCVHEVLDSKDCKVGTEIKRYLLQIEEKYEAFVTIGKITMNLKDNRDGNVVESVEGGGQCGLHGSGRPAECFRWHWKQQCYQQCAASRDTGKNIQVDLKC